MAKEIEKQNVTGLDSASNRKEAEYDLLTGLLEAADFKNSEDEVTVAEIRRNGKLLFEVHLHPISEDDFTFARKKATVYMQNPQGKKYPPIEKERNTAVLNSWIIYLATTEEDQSKIWGNRTIMDKFGLMQPVESIDKLLKFGEKQKLADLVTDISGFSDDEEEETKDEEEYAKN